MIKKTAEYNKCLEWIKNRISNLGPQNITDLMWYSEATNIDRSHLSYIINYDNNFVIDSDGFVCLNNKLNNLNTKVYSYGALKW